MAKNNQTATAEEVDEALFQDANNSSLLNSTFKIIKEQAASILKSPTIVTLPPPGTVAEKTGCACNCSCSKGAEVLLKNVTASLNKTLASYFSADGSFNSQLEGIIENKILELATNTSQSVIMNATKNSSVDSRVLEDSQNQLTNSQKNLQEILKDFNDRYEDFEDKYGKFVGKIDKVETAHDENKMVIDGLRSELDQLQSQFETLQTNTDEHIAENMGSKNTNLHQKDDLRSRVVDLENQFSMLDAQVDKMEVQIDNLEQNSRKGILVFRGIPFQSKKRHLERTTPIIIDFLYIHFGIRIGPRDISISHRQVIPAEKKKYGRNYIPPIYCKFLSRELAVNILERSGDCLANQRNVYGHPMSVEENLTLNRRMIWHQVETNLTDFKWKWIRNGNIYVRKNHTSKPVKISSERILKTLLSENPRKANTASLDPPHKESEPSTTFPSLPGHASSGHNPTAEIPSTGSYAEVTDQRGTPVPRGPTKYYGSAGSQNRVHPSNSHNLNSYCSPTSSYRFLPNFRQNSSRTPFHSVPVSTFKNYSLYNYSVFR